MSLRTPVGSILVYVGPGVDNAIGENLLKLPFLRALRGAFPDAHIAWVHGEGPWQFQGLLAPLAHGLVDEYIPDSAIDRSPGAWLPWRRPLDGRRFDLVIDTQKQPRNTLALKRVRHGTFVSATWRFFFSDARPPRETRETRSLVRKLLVLLATATGETPTPGHLASLPPAYRRAADRLLPAGPIYIGLAPGAGRQNTGKMWPLERFIDVARDQRAKGRTPVFFTGPREREWLPRIAEAVPDAALAPEEFTLADGTRVDGPGLTVALGAHVAAAVSNCSGTGHMLAAGGAPMVSLYGPTDPAKFAPYTPDLTVIRAQDFGSDAIEAIPLDAVIEAVETRLAAPCQPV